MLDYLASKYKKSWVIGSRIARELVGFSAGDRLPTIQEFTEKMHSSRGIVQKALDDLQTRGALTLEKRGKMGTYITACRREILLREGGVEHLTATMPSPLNSELSSLASGVCEAMVSCPVPFNFAFIQSADKRAEALSRSLYDFAITSRSAARRICAKYPDLSIMTSWENCIYSPPYMLFGNRPGLTSLAPGDRIAADPAALDQYFLTKKICKGKKVKLIERPYVTCRALFMAGDIDFLVYRHEKWVQDPKFTAIPIEYKNEADYLIPAVLINRHNYNIEKILEPYLRSDVIAKGQTAVLEHRHEFTIY